MEYLATPAPHEIWAGLGSYISPHQQVSLEAYPDDLTRRQAEILQEADVLRFDGSDLMPGAVGTGTFWSGIVDYVTGQDFGHHSGGYRRQLALRAIVVCGFDPPPPSGHSSPGGKQLRTELSGVIPNWGYP